MSLDVYLNLEVPQPVTRPTIFVREDGQTTALTREQWDARAPGRPPVEVVPDEAESTCVYEANITHNLSRMAEAAGLYAALWAPETLGITTARQLCTPLREGLARLTADPTPFRALTPPNGWGSYEGLVRFVADYLAACEQYPKAKVSVWR